MNGLAVGLVLALVPSLSFAVEPRVQRGRTFAQANCAHCHAIGPIGESPLRIAPHLSEHCTRAILSRASPMRWLNGS